MKRSVDKWMTLSVENFNLCITLALCCSFLFVGLKKQTKIKKIIYNCQWFFGSLSARPVKGSVWNPKRVVLSSSGFIFFFFTLHLLCSAESYSLKTHAVPLWNLLMKVSRTHSDLAKETFLMHEDEDGALTEGHLKSPGRWNVSERDLIKNEHLPPSLARSLTTHRCRAPRRERFLSATASDSGRRRGLKLSSLNMDLRERKIWMIIYVVFCEEL